ncbi:sialidase family protein [Tundrisphaera sp. TA3]|uniref:sialidase family protein n=1 Tax=Tundrisphaera sp. TA3 TaxID=3435775 RepID=UPI003EBBC456
MHRRRFLDLGGRAFTASALMPGMFRDEFATGPIASIDRDVIVPGRRDGGTWFHPRPCLVPGVEGSHVLMTVQSISGSDVFGPVQWTISSDLGKTWSRPESIPGLGRNDLGSGRESGVCDVVPEFHPPTGTVLAIGHNVVYRDGVLEKPQPKRWPIYVVRSPEGRWSDPKPLRWDDLRASMIYSCGCSQRLVLDDGDILVPLTFGADGREDRSVTSARCGFDGRDLRIRTVGNTLELPIRRGLLEPSLARFQGRYFMTIRAEDDRGYVSVSEDGLRWAPRQAWCWDDGSPLSLSTTQQHWLTHSDGLFLVYTRKTEANARVMRWRAPLFVAEVDPRTLRLVRASERVVVPLAGDPANQPDRVARMGNFHTLDVSPDESWVTVGEERPKDGWKGDTILARIRWRRPNRSWRPPGPV